VIEWVAYDTSIDHIHTKTLRSIDGMIFGRKAHALLAKFWPTADSGSSAAPKTRLVCVDVRETQGEVLA
jgi:hypothetical protein